MSEEKKGIEFGKEWIGETPIQKQMREEHERSPLPEGGVVIYPEDGYVPKGETVEIQTVKYVYSDSVSISRGADGEVHELGEMKKTYFPALGRLVEMPQLPISEGLQVPPWEELPNEAASDDMSDEGIVRVGPVIDVVDPATGETKSYQGMANPDIPKRWEDIPMDKPELFPPAIGHPKLEVLTDSNLSDSAKAFAEQLLSNGNLIDLPDVKVITQPTSQEELNQGYSWKLKMEIDPNEGKVVQAEIVGDGWGAELPPEQQTPEVQNGIPEDKLREVTVPFAADKIREYFQDKSLFFIANYSESKLKGQAFLTYLSNINIPSDVKFNTPISYDEYAEVMKAYMESISVINCAGLHVMAAEMLLVAKGLPYERSPYALPIDAQVVLMFIEEHYEMVQKWLHFIDSTQVYALRSIKSLNDHYKPEEVFPVVEDRSYVGSNIAQLFRIPEFIAVYFSIPNATYEMSYFRDQFEEYMFRNETLAKYFSSQNNFAALYFSHYATGLFKAEDINHGLFRIGVFDQASPYYADRPYEASIQV